MLPLSSGYAYMVVRILSLYDDPNSSISTDESRYPYEGADDVDLSAGRFLKKSSTGAKS